MDVAWGDAAEDSTVGLDIVGVRGLDQQMEALLVNGITTVSLRGRYLTILPWAIAEFFSSESEAGETSYSPDRLAAFLRRIEFLVLACTTVHGEDGSGAIGRQTFESQLKVLAAGGSVLFPVTGGGAMLGTYFGPCRAMGLLTNPPHGSAVPVAVTPRGNDVWQARRKALEGSAWREAVLAENIGLEDARALVAHFSLSSLRSFSDERAALRIALLEPWHSDHDVTGRVVEAYGRFTHTVDWLRAGGGAGQLRADALLAAAWRRAATGAEAGPADLAWAEYEWRCRLHFAIELMLSAVSAAVEELGEATVSGLISDWLAEADLPARLVVAWPKAGEARNMSGADARESIPSDLWLSEGIPGDLGSLRPHARALAAFALVAALAAQSAILRATGRFADRHEVGERALACVLAAGKGRFEDTLKSLAAAAIEAHLTTTFRKMGGRQKCSLRFFPEGPRLLATRKATSPGRSGTRLWNAIRLLQDAGVPGLGAVA